MFANLEILLFKGFYICLQLTTSPWRFGLGAVISHSVIRCLVFLLMKVKVLVAQSCPTFCDPMDCGMPISSGVGCHFLHQGIFLTQGLNPGLLHCRQIFYHLNYQRSPFLLMCVCAKLFKLCLTLCDRMDCNLPGSSLHGIFQVIVLEWVAMPFSDGSPRPRDWIHVSCVSCTGRRVLYH